MNAAEFAIASKFYPIVFSDQPPHLPVVIVGLRSGENAFATEEYRWMQGAYVRRYRFIFMENPERQQFILGVVEGSGLLDESGERCLFDSEDAATDLTNRARHFCRAFHGQHETTRQFVAALSERDLLTDNSTEICLFEGWRVEKQDYLIFDRERFEALDDKVSPVWQRDSWLLLIYSHIISGSNWPAIPQQTARRAGRDAD